jgi:hypothetical protein
MSAIVISAGRHPVGLTLVDLARVRPTGVIRGLMHCWNSRD